ncbi:MAG: DUF1259 domain-containing protein [Alphaproteobacteria bacterium]|nr:DUF1259 domain-containing protein [Alphaproteobacteria bacterium]
MKWVTHERPKLDRSACAWLIRRFIEKDAEFVYVPTEQVFQVATEIGATPYDIPDAEPFSHEGEFCSFDAFLKHRGLKVPALQTLAVIVRGADTARPDLAPQAAGLHTVSLGLSANFPDDHAMLEHGMFIYDALHTWCRDLQQEMHNWKPHARSGRSHMDARARLSAGARHLSFLRRGTLGFGGPVASCGLLEKELVQDRGWLSHAKNTAQHMHRARPLADRRSVMRKVLTLAVVSGLLAIMLPAVAADMDWSKVDQALGKKGTDQPGGVHKFGLPRTDLHVTIDGVAIKPSLALGGWLAFKSTGSEAMVMGDLVMAEDEINPVMSKLFAHGIMVTAVHNHLLRAQPPTFYMHVAGQGDPVKLATALHDALGASKTPLGAPGVSASQPAPSTSGSFDFDTAALETTIGHKGTANGGVYQFAIPRGDTTSDGGMVVPPAMGTAIAVNFQPTGGGKAAITGDFVLLGTEVNPVLKALRDNGIEVTAAHNHMLDDTPRTFFVHFWANDDAQKLAHGIRAALDKVNVAKS